MRSELFVRIIASLAILVPQLACAQLSSSTRAYQERYAVNLQGDFTVLGNTNIQCVAGCPVTATSNNSLDMGFVDIDGNGATVNSSRSDLILPAGAVVKYAALYWGGVGSSAYGTITNPPAALSMDQVKIMAPGAASYVTTNATVRNVESNINPSWDTFLAYADITTLVQTAGAGQYYVADIALVTGNDWTGPHGGWTMVVVYESVSIVTRRINIWDGFDFFGFGGSANFTVMGLNTPVSGAFETKVAYYGMDGEASHTGDFVAVNGTSLGNGLNPTNNVLNGSFSTLGAPVTTRLPLHNYNWGMDLDVFDATGLVPNSATTAAVELGSTVEGIWGGVFVISNEVAAPLITKNISPSTIELFETATVTMNISNPAGGVVLTGVDLIDSLPNGMVLANPVNFSSSCSGASTSSSPGDDFFRTTGGTISTGTSCTVQFDVTSTLAGSFTNIAPVREADFMNDQLLSLANQGQDDLVVNCPAPVLSVTSATNCVVDDGELRFSGFVGNTTWSIAYQFNAGPVIAGNYTANGSGEIAIQGLGYGNYSNIQASVSNCSVNLGAITIPYQDCPDNDSDGYSDYVDLDDDNDGILDIDENACSNENVAGTWGHTPGTAGSTSMPALVTSVANESYGSGFASNTIVGSRLQLTGVDATTMTEAIALNEYVEYGFTTSASFSTDHHIGQIAHFHPLTGPAGFTDYQFAVAVSDDAFTTNKILLYDENMTGSIGQQFRSPILDYYQLHPSTTYTFRTYFYNTPLVNGGKVTYDDFQVNACESDLDTDSDGVPDHLDLDSDNDGIYDALEAGHGQVYTLGRLSAGSDSYGIPLLVSDGLGGINYTYSNSSGTGALDAYSLDSDADGCNDVLEAGYTDANLDGLLGTSPLSVDPATGLVSSGGP